MTLSARSHGDGRPIVMLPWFALAGAAAEAAFEPALAPLVGWRRVYVDLPGTGSSPAVGSTSDAVLDAVAAAADALVGGRFVLAGCSYGGYIASGLARRMPGRVAGLVLVSSGVRIDPAERNLDGVAPSTPDADWLADVPPELHEHFERAIGVQTRAVASRTAAAFAACPPADDAYLEHLRATGYGLSDEASAATYDGPTLMLIGRSDRVAGYRDQLDAMARYPHGDYVALSGTGHYLPLERTAAFADVVSHWLARELPGSLAS
jgi:pimeloyl-ACP methyl ester carboxylesterase